MGTWKKVLLEGQDLYDNTDVTGNKADPVAGSAIAITTSDGTSLDNRLLGDDIDVTIAVDPGGLSDLGSGVASSDHIIVFDGGASGTTKKTSLANAIASVSTGVTTIEFTTDETYDDDDNPDTADVVQSTGTDSGAVSVKFEGGVGMATSIKTNQGDNIVLISATDASVVADGTAAASDKGVASFSSDNFAISSGHITIKAKGIVGAEIADTTITNDQISGSAGIVASKLADIAATNKVKLSAIDFDTPTPETTYGNLADADEFIFHDASAADTDGSDHKTTTLGTIKDYFANGIASFSTVHNSVGTGLAQSVDTSGVDVIDTMSIDANGHVGEVVTRTLPSAEHNVTGVVDTSTQTFGGVKTFKDGAVVGQSGVGGDLTVHGSLFVNGTTTTLDTATLEVQDRSIVAAVPADDHADTPAGVSAALAAAEGGGFFLATHHDAHEDDAFYAGLSWSDTGGLTGWSLNDAATTHVPGENEAYDSTLDSSSAKYAVSVMDFSSTAEATPNGSGAGNGQFFLNTEDQKLYIRVS